MKPANPEPGAKVRGLLAMREGVTVTLSQMVVGGRGMTAIVPMDTRGATTVSVRR
jgi:hypothetical protein